MSTSGPELTLIGHGGKQADRHGCFCHQLQRNRGEGASSENPPRLNDRILPLLLCFQTALALPCPGMDVFAPCIKMYGAFVSAFASPGILCTMQTALKPGMLILTLALRSVRKNNLEPTSKRRRTRAQTVSANWVDQPSQRAGDIGKRQKIHHPRRGRVGSEGEVVHLFSLLCVGALTTGSA